jgi:hypothetical protein
MWIGKIKQDYGIQYKLKIKKKSYAYFKWTNNTIDIPRLIEISHIYIRCDIYTSTDSRWFG